MSDRETIIRVTRVSGPYFAEMRHEATGAGWIVGAVGLTMGDGREVAHAHWAFEQQQEAEAQALLLRGKMQ